LAFFALRILNVYYRVVEQELFMNQVIVLAHVDEDIITNDTSTPTPVSTSRTPLGPITRARARRLTHLVSRAMNVVSSINRVIPHLSLKDQEQTVVGSHLVIRARLFGERLPILRYFFYFPTVQKKPKIVEIFPPTALV
jgi:hypothetical protein